VCTFWGLVHHLAQGTSEVNLWQWAIDYHGINWILASVIALTGFTIGWMVHAPRKA